MCVAICFVRAITGMQMQLAPGCYKPGLPRHLCANVQVDKAWEMLPGGKLQHRPNWRSAL